MKKKLNNTLYGRLLAAALSLALALPIITSFGALAADPELIAPEDTAQSLSSSVPNTQEQAPDVTEETPDVGSGAQSIQELPLNEADSSSFPNASSEAQGEEQQNSQIQTDANSTPPPNADSLPASASTAKSEDITESEINIDALSGAADKATDEKTDISSIAPRAAGALPPYTMSLFSSKADGTPGNEITSGEISLYDNLFIRIKWEKLEGAAHSVKYPLQAYSNKLAPSIADGNETFKTKDYPGAPIEGKPFVTLFWAKDSRELSVSFIDMGTTPIDGTDYEILQILANAEVYFSCGLAQSGLDADDQGNVKIEFPGQTNPIAVTVSELKPKAPLLLKSDAVFNSNGTADWKIEYTHSTAAYKGERPTELNDTLPAGLEFASEIAIAIDGVAVPPIAQPVQNSFKYTLPIDIAAGAKVAISYTTRLTSNELSQIWNANGSPGKRVYQNNASGTINDAELSAPLSAKGKLEVTNGWQGFKAMTKKGKLLAPNVAPNNTSGWVVNWEVIVNAMSQSYKQLSVTDMLGKGFNLDMNSVKVNNISVAPTLTQSGTKNLMTIDLIKEGNAPAVSELTYTITYTTSIDQNYFDQPESSNGFTDEDVTNGAKLNYKWPDGTGSGNSPIPPSVVKPGDIGLSGDLIVKSTVGSYNPITHELGWTVTVNPNKVDITKALIVDDLSQSSPHHEFTDTAESEIKAMLSALAGEVKIENNKLTVKLGSIGRQSVTFSFKTRVTSPAIWAGNVKDKTFSNTVKYLKAEQRLATKAF